MQNGIVQKLSEKLLGDLQVADEIFIAVALISFDGLSHILDHINGECKQNYLVGIDLPTEPRALKKLDELQYQSEVQVKIFTAKPTFHPKLYLIRKGKGYIAYVGSGNCTNGGLFNNVELAVRLSEIDQCRELLQWFNYHLATAKPLTSTFIDEYQIDFSKRLEYKKADERISKRDKVLLNEEYEATLSERSAFISALKKYRRTAEYSNVVKDREDAIIALKRTLDYPAFDKIDIDRYFSIWELGHLIAIAIPAIKRNMRGLKSLLRWLCNENIDIAVRYQEALSGKYKVEGVSKAFISKVLVMHRPDLYYVKNDKTEKGLQKYGIKTPRGISDGEKYKAISNFLRQVNADTGIKDLAVLDYFLYVEGGQ